MSVATVPPISPREGKQGEKPTTKALRHEGILTATTRAQSERQTSIPEVVLRHPLSAPSAVPTKLDN